MSARLAPNYDLYQLEVVDITGNRTLLHQANTLTSIVYSKYLTTTVDIKQVFDDLFPHESGSSDNSRTIAVLATTQNQNSKQLLGCIRINFPYLNSTNNIVLEAMEYLHVDVEWDQFCFAGFNIQNSFELGRLCILPELTMGQARKTNFYLTIIYKLVSGACDIALKHFAKKQAWAVMHTHVVNAVIKSNIQVIKAPSIRLNSEKNQKIINRYSRYWVDKKIGFYKVIPNKTGL